MEANSSEAVQAVRDALLEGRPVPEGALSQLTPEERTEMASLTATSALVQATLRQPEHTEAGQNAALLRAQEALSAAPRVGPAPARDSLWDRIARIWRGRPR